MRSGIRKEIESARDKRMSLRNESTTGHLRWHSINSQQCGWWNVGMSPQVVSVMWRREMFYWEIWDWNLLGNFLVLIVLNEVDAARVVMKHQRISRQDIFESCLINERPSKGQFEHFCLIWIFRLLNRIKLFDRCWLKPSTFQAFHSKLQHRFTSIINRDI